MLRCRAAKRTVEERMKKATDDDRRVGVAVPRRPTGEGRLLSRQPWSQVVAGSNLSVTFDSAHAGVGSY